MSLGRVQGERNEQDAEVLLCSTQTLVVGRTVRELGLIIYDESHHVRAPGSMAVLGVTATPYRTDGNELGDVFTYVTHEMTILDGILGRYLCDVRGKRVEIPGFDLKRLRLVAGNYNQEDLSTAMGSDDALAAVVEAVQDFAADRKSLLFAVDVAHAHAQAKRLGAAGIPAAAVDGEMTDAERKRALKNFAKGKTRVLVNCQLLTEHQGCKIPDLC
ncbi:MAG: DEAD/DEAH box helicase [Bacilli bacterium]